ncbi:hypothetical protein BKA62DRAFT_194375 [Auriculariales sp. MPI-PUGE-AT-0066]|nr:hypothetical protein BKA62DRAFT_194375 [Auriculariales sp. MPI-PUGE-AT-0066]
MLDNCISTIFHQPHHADRSSFEMNTEAAAAYGIGSEQLETENAEAVEDADLGIEEEEEENDEDAVSDGEMTEGDGEASTALEALGGIRRRRYGDILIIDWQAVHTAAGLPTPEIPLSDIRAELRAQGIDEQFVPKPVSATAGNTFGNAIIQLVQLCETTITCVQMRTKSTCSCIGSTTRKKPAACMTRKRRRRAWRHVWIVRSEI